MFIRCLPREEKESRTDSKISLLTGTHPEVAKWNFYKAQPTASLDAWQSTNWDVLCPRSYLLISFLPRSWVPSDPLPTLRSRGAGVGCGRRARAPVLPRRRSPSPRREGTAGQARAAGDRTSRSSAAARRPAARGCPCASGSGSAATARCACGAGRPPGTSSGCSPARTPRRSSAAPGRAGPRPDPPRASPGPPGAAETPRNPLPCGSTRASARAVTSRA